MVNSFKRVGTELPVVDSGLLCQISGRRSVFEACAEISVALRRIIARRGLSLRFEIS
jgi:hypothetical protein